MLNDIKDWTIETGAQVVTETETMGVMDWSGVTLVVGAICLLAGAMVVIDLFRP